jgi:hypothetical protein
MPWGFCKACCGGLPGPRKIIAGKRLTKKMVKETKAERSLSKRLKAAF